VFRLHDGLTRRSIEAWNSDIEVPKIVNKTILREILYEDFSQVSDQGADLMEIVIYSLVKYLSNSVMQIHGNGRLTPERIRDAMMKDDIINLNYGSITVVNESSEVSELRIAQRVLGIIAGSKVDRKVKEKEVDFEELIEGLGADENECEESEGIRDETEGT